MTRYFTFSHSPKSSLYCRFVIALAAALMAGVASLDAEELDLKALKSLKTEQTSLKQPYVGVYGGTTRSQDANITIGTVMNDLAVPYPIMEDTGAAIIGFEVGQRWRMKKMPFDVGLGFQGSILATSLAGALADPSAAQVDWIANDVAQMGFAGIMNPTDQQVASFLGDVQKALAVPTAANASAFDINDPQDLLSELDPDDVKAFKTDLNAAIFMLNGTVGLNLRRYRPYLGKHLSNVRPYVSGGIGGGQLWFRNVEFESVSEAEARLVREYAARKGLKVPDEEDQNTTPAAATVFTSDAFVFAYQFAAGVEYKFNDKAGAFFEYRHLAFDSFDEEVSDYENTLWTGGLRFFYDKEDMR